MSGHGGSWCRCGLDAAVEFLGKCHVTPSMFLLFRAADAGTPLSSSGMACWWQMPGFVQYLVAACDNGRVHLCVAPGCSSTHNRMMARRTGTVAAVLRGSWWCESLTLRNVVCMLAEGTVEGA